MDAAQTTELWCHHQVSSWEGDACCRCIVKILTPGWSRGGTWHSNSPCPHHPREETGVLEDNPRWPTPVHPCRDNSGRMAWGYQGCTQSSTPIPQPPWCHDFDHTTSSPRNPRSNGQAEATVKITKGLLTHAKYSGQDPYLALLAYRSTPINAHLCSPAEMLYQRAIRTTVPQGIRHKDPQAAADQDHLNDHAIQSTAYHDHHCRPKSPLYAGQTVSVLNDTKTLWLPATAICQARHGSYLVQVIGRGQYQCACNHIRECHPDAVKPDMPVSTDVAPATPESSPGLFPVRPAPAAPATAPVAPATPKPQPAVPTASTPSNTPRKSAGVMTSSIKVHSTQ